VNRQDGAPRRDEVTEFNLLVAGTFDKVSQRTRTRPYHASRVKYETCKSDAALRAHLLWAPRLDIILTVPWIMHHCALLRRLVGAEVDQSSDLRT
jgi:hypothetical protein